MGLDIERPIRDEVARRLVNVCECRIEAPLRHEMHGVMRADVLCRPIDPLLRDLTFVVEVKSLRIAGDRHIGHWIKQTADYVGSVPSAGDWPPVVAGFMWLVGVELQSNERPQIAGMVQLAQHFRVGYARHSVNGARLMLTFGACADVFHEGRGEWLPRAVTLLNAKRNCGGTRKNLSAR